MAARNAQRGAAAHPAAQQASGPTPPWQKLSPELIRRIAAFLPPTQVAISLKLLDRATAAALQEFRTVAIARKMPAWMSEGFGINDKSSSQPPASKWFCLARPDVDFRLFLNVEWSRDAFWRRLNLRQRRQVLCTVASCRDPVALHVPVHHSGCSLTSPMLAAAAATGDVDTCSRLLHEFGCPWESCISWAAAGHGQLQAWAWAQAVEGEEDMASRGNVPQPLEMLEAACSSGNLAAVERAEEAWEGHLQMNYDAYSTHDDADMGVMGAVWAAIKAYGDDDSSNSTGGGLGSSSAGRGLGGSAAGAPGAVGTARSSRPAAAAAAAGRAFAQPHRERDGVLERCMRQLLNYSPMSAHNRLNVLFILAETCPLALLQRYHDPLLSPPPAAAAGGDGELFGAMGAPGGIDNDDETIVLSSWDKRSLLVAALGSRTPDWEQKADWLLQDKWGAGVAAEDSLARLMSCERPEGRTVFSVSLWRKMAQLPDCLQRLPRLAARGVSMSTRGDVSEAVCGAAGAGRHEVLRHLLEVVCPALQLTAADVATGEERRKRCTAGTRLPCAVAAEAPGMGGAEAGGSTGAGGAAEAGGGAVAPAAAAGDDCPWSAAFSRIAEAGSDLDLLRLLHEERGAAVDMLSVAKGGSVEQLEWAAAALRAAGQQPQALTAEQLWRVACDWGNTATAGWLLDHSLAEVPTVEFVCGQLEAHSGAELYGGVRWWLGVMDSRADEAACDPNKFDQGLRSHWGVVVSAAAALVEQHDASTLAPYQLRCLRYGRYQAARQWLADVRQRRHRAAGELGAAEAEAAEAWDDMEHGPESEPSYMSRALSSGYSTEEDEGVDEDADEDADADMDEDVDEDDGED
ncbi:hypothetical protein HYH02_002527 [Chlamydomonas schloesseri]|uniref:Uncharacterized protein n=1 Tax=Chlamydomonas schloesseri TaxID=2026947 RepID=A0A836BBV2_9CHLO|nr:hypothetical protein HYH02_002527 [Chlamydomonas schloesseri]|eukprot:KAG2453204.1 hypothetical protein HYH02_002527 [Chlamydomonas schloesseri]